MIMRESFSLCTDGQVNQREASYSGQGGTCPVCRAGCCPHSSANVWCVFVAKSKEGKTTNSKGPNTEICRTPGCDVEYLSWTDDHQIEED